MTSRVCAALVGWVFVLSGCGPDSGGAGESLNWTLGHFGEVGSSPGQFSYPRAMDASDDSLWIIDKLARVQRIDPASGRALGEWQMPEWEMGKPTGITVWNPSTIPGDELVYVADTHYFRVMVFRASDAKPGIHSVRASSGTAQRGSESANAISPQPVASFGSYGEEDGQFVYVTDIALLPTADGKSVDRVYVSEYGGHDRISVFQAPADVSAFGGEYTFLFSVGKFGSGVGHEGATREEVEFSRPQSIAIDVKRRELIVADACNHRVGRFTLEGTLISWMGSPDLASREPGLFNYPYGLTLLDDSTALVAEFGNNRVQRIDIGSSTSLGVFGMPGRGEGQLATPWAVTTLGGKAYVLDSGNNRVVAFRNPSR